MAQTLTTTSTFGLPLDRDLSIDEEKLAFMVKVAFQEIKSTVPAEQRVISLTITIDEDDSPRIFGHRLDGDVATLELVTKLA